MPREGLEPTNPCGKRILSPPRLPVSPPRHGRPQTGQQRRIQGEAASGFEPLNRGFADPRLNLLATPPSTTRGEWSGRRDSNPRPPPWQGGVLPLNYFRAPTIVLTSGEPFKAHGMPRGRLELPRALAHHPLKMACLPFPPPRHGRGGRIRTHDRRFWRPLLYQTELRPCVTQTTLQVPLGRFERPTRGLGNRCSILLSYRGRSGDRGTRTPNLRDANAALSLLSYVPNGGIVAGSQTNGKTKCNRSGPSPVVP